MATTMTTAITTSAMSLIVGVTLIPVVAVVVVGCGFRLGNFGAVSHIGLLTGRG
jgi:hypothetical protein